MAVSKTRIKEGAFSTISFKISSIKRWPNIRTKHSTYDKTVTSAFGMYKNIKYDDK